MGELAQLSGRPVLVDAYAQGPVDALIIAPERLRALLVAEAEMGERIMRALILRRVGLIEAGAGGPVIVGHAESGDVLRLQGFLSRNGHPQQTLNPDTDAEAKALMLRNPGEDDLARCIGLVGPIDSDRVYDVVIVGAGQAGASARIENYMGFPTGITGMALMARAYNQAQKFGVEMAMPDEAIGIQVPVEAADSEYIPGRDGRQSRLAWAGGCMPPSPGVRLRPGM